MANWKYKLELKDLIEKYQDDKLSVQELGRKVAERIREQTYYFKRKGDLEPIACAFENLEEDVEDFDFILNDLYDWGDSITAPSDSIIQNKMCWVNTLF